MGHPRRRNEAAPLLRQKFLSNLGSRFEKQRGRAITDVFDDPQRLEAMPVDVFMNLFQVEESG